MSLQVAYKNLVDAQAAYEAAVAEEQQSANEVARVIEARKNVARKKEQAHNNLLKAKAAALEAI